MIRNFIIFVVILWSSKAEDVADDDAECDYSFSAAYWEGVYDFISIPGGGQFTFVYKSTHGSKNLNKNFYRDDDLRFVADYGIFLIKGSEKVVFQSEASMGAISWMGGHTARYYTIDEASGNMTITDVGIAQQTFSFTRGRGIFALTLAYPKMNKYALLGVGNFPAVKFVADVRKYSEIELISLYPEHYKVIKEIYS